MTDKTKIIVTFVLFIMLLAMGTYAYHRMEGWDYVDSLYFSTITIMTIGYGDLHPTNDASKIFTIFYIVLGVSVGLFALSSVASYIYQNNYEKAYVEARRRFDNAGLIEKTKKWLMD